MASDNSRAEEVGTRMLAHAGRPAGLEWRDRASGLDGPGLLNREEPDVVPGRS